MKNVDMTTAWHRDPNPPMNVPPEQRYQRSKSEPAAIARRRKRSAMFRGTHGSWAAPNPDYQLPGRGALREKYEWLWHEPTRPGHPGHEYSEPFYRVIHGSGGYGDIRSGWPQSALRSPRFYPDERHGQIKVPVSGNNAIGRDFDNSALNQQKDFRHAAFHSYGSGSMKGFGHLGM